MANMSYCMFNNTKEDLADCLEALIDRDISSEDERIKAENMMMMFLDFCKRSNIISEYDEKVVYEIIEECERVSGS